jgi:hypothetical protein
LRKDGRFNWDTSNVGWDGGEDIDLPDQTVVKIVIEVDVCIESNREGQNPDTKCLGESEASASALKSWRR